MESVTTICEALWLGGCCILAILSGHLPMAVCVLADPRLCLFLALL